MKQLRAEFEIQSNKYWDACIRYIDKRQVCAEAHLDSTHNKVSRSERKQKRCGSNMNFGFIVYRLSQNLNFDCFRTLPVQICDTQTHPEHLLARERTGVLGSLKFRHLNDRFTLKGEKKLSIDKLKHQWTLRKHLNGFGNQKLSEREPLWNL